MTLIRSLTHVLIAIIVLLTSLVAAPVSAQDEVVGFDIGLEPVAMGLQQPLAVVDAGDDSGRLFVVEQEGTIRIVVDGEVSGTPFLDITDRVGSGAYEQGLLGLAFAPNYAASGLFYVNYTDLSGNTMVSRFTDGEWEIIGRTL